MDSLDDLKRGRESYGRMAWADAYRALALADQAVPLGAEDLELLAISAYLTGREGDFLKVLERAHHAYLDAGERVRAARSGFWLGLGLLLGGEIGRATGWLARAQRLLERDDCVERGYLLLPVAEQQLRSGNFRAAHSAGSDAAAIGERFGDADLIACARHLQGRTLLLQGEVEAGLALLDEAMIAVTANEVSPVMTGLIYCSVILACRQVYALSRAREWTSALAQWCKQQPDIVAFTGACLVHRAEVMQLHGAWQDALEEAGRACRRFVDGIDPKPPGAAFYQQGEVHRLLGGFVAAEEAYRSASQGGFEPQPGLALLRLAQGRTEAAASAIRRVVKATTGRLERTKFLPAYVEIMVAGGDIQEARGACRELSEIAERFGTSALGAMAAQARGEVELAEGSAGAALAPLREAWQVWEQSKAPYLAARVRVLLAMACRLLGDNEGAGLELDAARVALERLKAAPDLARIGSLGWGVRPRQPGGLTRRELQVLRMVAAGRTNRAIAAALSLSEKTVDRHVSNIFTKLDVTSRAAATAFAYEHKLL